MVWSKIHRPPSLPPSAGNYAIECDLQLSADGEAMVFHDETLDRLTVAQGPLSARNSDELKAIALKNTDDRMITLCRVVRTRCRPCHLGDRNQEPLRRRHAAGRANRRSPASLCRPGCRHVFRPAAGFRPAHFRAGFAARAGGGEQAPRGQRPGQRLELPWRGGRARARISSPGRCATCPQLCR